MVRIAPFLDERQGIALVNFEVPDRSRDQGSVRYPDRGVPTWLSGGPSAPRAHCGPAHDGAQCQFGDVSGFGQNEIARRLNRTVNVTESRAAKLGIKLASANAPVPVIE
jgi:hypothetical protein